MKKALIICTGASAVAAVISAFCGMYSLDIFSLIPALFIVACAANAVLYESRLRSSSGTLFLILSHSIPTFIFEYFTAEEDKKYYYSYQKATTLCLIPISLVFVFFFKGAAKLNCLWVWFLVTFIAYIAGAYFKMKKLKKAQKLRERELDEQKKLEELGKFK